jgi:hypothetical protein
MVTTDVTFGYEVGVFFESLGLAVEQKNDWPFVFEHFYCPTKALIVHCVPMQTVSHTTAQGLVALSELAQKHHLKIIHLAEDLWRTKPAIVASRLRALIGISQRIGARQTQVQRIDKPTLDAFLEANHLQSTTQAKFKYGLTNKRDGFLVAVASFSGGRNIVREDTPLRSYELIRFANVCNCTVVGGLDKLLKAFIRDQQPDHLMTYADRDWSNGQSYERLGFMLLATTPPQMFNINTENFTRINPKNTPTNLENSCIEVWNTGNLKYYKLL